MQKDLGLWEEHAELGCREGTGVRTGWEGQAAQVMGYQWSTRLLRVLEP